MEKPTWTQNYEKTPEHTRECTQSKEKEDAEDSSYPKSIEVMLRETARKSYPENDDNPMLAPRDQDVRQSDESWSFRTKISGSDPQIYPCTFLSFRLFVSCTSKVIVEGHLRIWKPRTEPSRVRSNTQGYDLAVTVLLAMKSSTLTFSARSFLVTKIASVCDGRLRFTITATCPSDCDM